MSGWCNAGTTMSPRPRRCSTPPAGPSSPVWSRRLSFPRGPGPLRCCSRREWHIDMVSLVLSGSVISRQTFLCHNYASAADVCSQYASGATVQIILFATLAIELKRRAPNAHTVLEVIRARYGRYPVWKGPGLGKYCLLTTVQARSLTASSSALAFSPISWLP